VKQVRALTLPESPSIDPRELPTSYVFPAAFRFANSVSFFASSLFKSKKELAETPDAFALLDGGMSSVQ